MQNSTGNYLKLIASMLIFGSIGLFRRFIPLSSALLACFRGFSGALLLVLIVCLTRRKLRNTIGVKNLVLLIISGGLIGLNWLLLFDAFKYTTIATATLCYYMQPTIVILLSPIVFHDKLKSRQLIAVIMSLVGMVLVSGIIGAETMPSVPDVHGIFCGLGAALLYATVVMMNKKIVGVDAYEKTILQLFFAALVLVPFLIGTEDWGSISLGAFEIVMLLIVGFIHTGLAYLMYFGSMEHLKARTVAMFSYIDPVSALLLSWVFLREPLTAAGLVGAVLILGAAWLGES